MVAHFTMRTYGVNQEFRFAEGIWLHRKSLQIRNFSEKTFLHHTCETFSEQPSHMKTMVSSVTDKVANREEFFMHIIEFLTYCLFSMY